SQQLYPGGVVRLSNAIEATVSGLDGPARDSLEEHLQQATLLPRGGLTACLQQTGVSSEKALVEALLVDTALWLEHSAPSADVADCFLDRHRNGAEGRAAELKTMVGWAKPTVAAASVLTLTGDGLASSGEETVFAAVPNSPAGKEIYRTLQQFPLDGRLVVVPGSVDCCFCRVATQQQLAKLLPKWLLESRRMYDMACQSRFTPHLFATTVRR
ncbi:MAG: hypothetical protein ACRC1K_14030, partial [Planctomycetia bacterium]